jgi:ADP-dependent NAD(P)H-hydrate dehydratase / NAD(P)H-hydrate epimerase
MIPLYSTKQIRDLDSFAINTLGVPDIVLMENAAREIFNNIKIYTEDFSNKKFGIVCGKGNNGGDGMAVARHLVNAGYNVRIIWIGNLDELSENCRTNFSILQKMLKDNANLQMLKFKKVSDLNKISDCNIYIDAMLGSGIRGELKEPYSSCVKKLNSFIGYKIAIDVPTGLNSDTGFTSNSFNADLTITLGEFKTGLFIGDGSVVSGEIEKGSIGISDSYYQKYDNSEFLIEPEDALNGLPKKKKNLNKYSAGKVLTIAGSGKLPGAAVLTSKAVLAIGAGASILSFPKSVRTLIQKKLGEVIVESYEDEGTEYLSTKMLSSLIERIKWADVIAIGPGLGREKETQEAVRKIVNQNKKMVIDADALFALKNHYKKINLKNKILTPHLGEFSILIDKETDEVKKDLIGFGRKFVEDTGSFLVLKGSPTIIFNPEGEALINTVGNPSLAKFGTGDVLTGFIAGLLSQQTDIEKAVVTAVYLHSLTADILLKKKTEYSILAGDLISHLPASIKFLRKSIV